MYPALLNIYSDGMLVPQIQRNCLASCAKLGNLPSSFFHHCSGSISIEATGECHNSPRVAMTPEQKVESEIASYLDFPVILLRTAANPFNRFLGG